MKTLILTAIRCSVSRVLLVGLALSGALAPGLYAVEHNCRPPNACRVDTTYDKHDQNYPNGPFDGVCADEDGNCSLRAAIEESNDWTAGKVILPAGVYRLTLGQPLKITSNLRLVGEGVSRFPAPCTAGPTPTPTPTPAVQIDGGGVTRVLIITPFDPEI